MNLKIIRILALNTLLCFVMVSALADADSTSSNKPKKKSLAHRARKRKADFIEKNIPNYLNMQVALYKDMFEPAGLIARSILEGLNQEENSDPDLKESLEKMVQAKKIEELRAEFKNFSAHFVQWVQSNFINDVDIIACAQSNSQWIQRKGEINNPFDLAELKSCGVSVK